MQRIIIPTWLVFMKIVEQRVGTNIHPSLPLLHLLSPCHDSYDLWNFPQHSKTLKPIKKNGSLPSQNVNSRDKRPNRNVLWKHSPYSERLEWIRKRRVNMPNHLRHTFWMRPTIKYSVNAWKRKTETFRTGLDDPVLQHSQHYGRQHTNRRM